MIGTSDPYVYPGTDVLKNFRDIRDSASLALFEGRSTFRRLKELADGPVKGAFDVSHLKATHKYIFQDVSLGLANFVPSTSQKAAIPSPEPTSSIYL